MPDELIEAYAKFYSYKEVVGMDTCNNKKNNDWREKDLTNASGQGDAGQ